MSLAGKRGTGSPDSIAAHETALRDAVFGPADKADKKWELYRDMIHSRMRDVLSRCLPRTFELLGEEDRVAEYLESAPPDSPLMRDVPSHFATWLSMHSPDKKRTELAQLEAAQFDLTHLAEDSTPGDALSLELPAALLTPHIRHSFEWNVVSDPPVVGPVSLLLFRAPASHEVIALALSPSVARLWDLLKLGTPLGEALRRSLPEGAEPTAEHVEELTDVLTKWSEIGLILGSRSP